MLIKLQLQAINTNMVNDFGNEFFFKRKNLLNQHCKCNTPELRYKRELISDKKNNEKSATTNLYKKERRNV